MMYFDNTEEGDGSHQRASYLALQRLVDSHEASLALEARRPFFEGAAPHWIAERDVLSISLGSSRDRVASSLSSSSSSPSIADTLGSANMAESPLFYRTILCFTSAVVEMQSLTEHLHKHLILPLVLFGDENNCEVSISAADAQRGAMHLLSRHLQDVWTWQRRVTHVVQYVLRQLASLQASPLPGGAARLMSVWQSLASLLGAVVTLEEVLHQHTALQQGISMLRKWAVTTLATAGDENSSKEVGIGGDDEEEETLASLQTVLRTVFVDVLSGAILERILLSMDVPTDAPTAQDSDTLPVVGTNSHFRKEFMEVLSFMTASLERALNSPRESVYHQRMVGILAMHMAYNRLFQRPGGASQKELGVFREVCKKTYALSLSHMPVICIEGVFVMYPSMWLFKYLGSDVGIRKGGGGGAKDDLPNALQVACQQQAVKFLPLVNRLTTIMTLWMSDMQFCSPHYNNNSKTGSVYSSSSHHFTTTLDTLTLLLQRGLFLSRDLQHAMTYLIALHHCCGTPMTPNLLDGILLGASLLIRTRHTYHDAANTIAASFNTVVGSIVYTLEKHLYSIYEKLSGTGKDADIQRVAISEALTLLHRPQTKENTAAISVILDVIVNRQPLNAARDSVLMDFSQLRRVVHHQEELMEVTDCRFLYWQRETVYPFFFKRLYQCPRNARRLPHIVAAMHDSQRVIFSAEHTMHHRAILGDYVAFVRDCMQQNMIHPLCTEIENDLRMVTHGSVLGGDQRLEQALLLLQRAPPLVSSSSSSSRGGAAIRSLTNFTEMGAFRFFDEWVHIAALVEDYLDVQFYNLCALTLNDWKMYEGMRNVAKERYGLSICDGHLPGGIVDQGLDVLVITEGIQVFIAHYTYNINEQIFVQRPTSTQSKHLHTLHIRHITNSIRTHGTGIMSTAVNHVYKCLLKKLSILSQFLYDDHVKSRLLKDEKFVLQKRGEKKTNATASSVYTMGRAQQFVDEIALLGLADDGMTFLDKFRCLVSEIGNALGYMRMMRSGGLRAIADASQFVPAAARNAPEQLAALVAHSDEDEDDDDSDDLSGNGDADSTTRSSSTNGGEDNDAAVRTRSCTQESTKSVARVARSLLDKLAQGSEYFSALLDAIGRRLCVDKYTHLRLFYLIVPPMCITFTEHMVREKEKLLKKGKDAIFTDDGFVLGCTFLLCLLRQEDTFLSLQWFDGVRAEYLTRLRKVHEALMAKQSQNSETNDSGGMYMDNEQERVNNMHLTASTLDGVLREYVGLEEAFIAASVFFRSDTLPRRREQCGDDEDDESDSGVETDSED